jgi:adenylylsulfate kinase-like enzyme
MIDQGKGFTGIDDPYEPPKSPDIELDGNIDGYDNVVKCATEIYEKIKDKI